MLHLNADCYTHLCASGDNRQRTFRQVRDLRWRPTLKFTMTGSGIGGVIALDRANSSLPLFCEGDPLPWPRKVRRDRDHGRSFVNT